MTHKHSLLWPHSAALPEEAAVAESCYSRWSPLFGNGPDHVTTKWWKLWAVCKLSISTERLGAGNRQGTWRHIHALRRKRTEIPEPQQRWVDGFLFCGGKKKRKRDMFLFFFPPTQPADRKREWGRGCCHQHCGPVLWKCSSASSMEDAHNSWCWFLLFFCNVGVCHFMLAVCV